MQGRVTYIPVCLGVKSLLMHGTGANLGFIWGFCVCLLYVNVLTHVGGGQRTISGVGPCLPLCVVRFLFSLHCLCQVCWLLRILLSASHLVGRLGL